MCSDINRISQASYLTSPAFPAGFRGTGICMCRVKPTEKKWARASIEVVHTMLSDVNVCNEVLDISIEFGRQQIVVHECSPNQFGQRKYLVRAREMRVSFRRIIPTKENAKTVVWLGIRGMFTLFHDDVTPYTIFQELVLCEGNPGEWGMGVWCCGVFP